MSNDVTPPFRSELTQAAIAADPREAFTHYLPIYGRYVSEHRSVAVCGFHALDGMHALYPTCPDCLRMLKADDAAREAAL